MESLPKFTPKRIRALRSALGLSRREMALRLRISNRTLECWEDGFAEPKGPTSLVLEHFEYEAGIAKVSPFAAAL